VAAYLCQSVAGTVRECVIMPPQREHIAHCRRNVRFGNILADSYPNLRHLPIANTGQKLRRCLHTETCKRPFFPASTTSNLELPKPECAWQQKCNICISSPLHRFESKSSAKYLPRHGCAGI